MNYHCQIKRWKMWNQSKIFQFHQCPTKKQEICSSGQLQCLYKVLAGCNSIKQYVWLNWNLQNNEKDWWTLAYWKHSSWSTSTGSDVNFTFLQTIKQKLTICMKVDGDKFVCMDSILRKENCIIYSFGLAADWTFEDMMDRMGNFFILKKKFGAFSI